MDVEKLEGIRFDVADVTFQLEQSAEIESWLQQLVKAEGKQIDLVQYVFCSDPYLLEINIQYLGHDTFTDIITFPYALQPIRSDIYISIDRIKENALTFDTTFQNELHRVLAHGLLHLCGYQDKGDSDKRLMRDKENYYLSILNVSKCIE